MRFLNANLYAHNFLAIIILSVRGGCSLYIEYPARGPIPPERTIVIHQNQRDKEASYLTVSSAYSYTHRPELVSDSIYDWSFDSESSLIIYRT